MLKNFQTQSNQTALFFSPQPERQEAPKTPENADKKPSSFGTPEARNALYSDALKRINALKATKDPKNLETANQLKAKVDQAREADKGLLESDKVKLAVEVKNMLNNILLSARPAESTPEKKSKVSSQALDNFAKMQKVQASELKDRFGAEPTQLASSNVKLTNTDKPSAQYKDAYNEPSPSQQPTFKATEINTNSNENRKVTANVLVGARDYNYETLLNAPTPDENTKRGIMQAVSQDALRNGDGPGQVRYVRTADNKIWEVKNGSSDKNVKVRTIINVVEKNQNKI